MVVSNRLDYDLFLIILLVETSMFDIKVLSFVY